MEKFIKPIMITKSFLPPIDEYKKEIDKIWETNWLTNMGPIHNEFEKKMKKYLKIGNLSLFTNGHLALETAIKGLKLKGEVITTPFTFASTTHAIVNCGLKPVFCDIEPDTFNIDVNKIEALITNKTCAILPVHVFGNPCDISGIEEIAKKHNLKLIYDAAHCFGVELNGIGIGNYGDISMFSLHATKVFHSIEGGILSFKDIEFEKRVRLLRNFGISGPESVEEVGTNAKMNEFQAAMGVVNLRYIDDEISKRKKIAYLYREKLENVKGIRILRDLQGVKHNYSYFPIIIDGKKLGISRDELFERLKEFNIFSRKYFYPLTTEYDCYKGKFNSDVPIAKYISERVLTLPIYGSLEHEAVEKICEIISDESQKEKCL